MTPWIPETFNLSFTQFFLPTRLLNWQQAWRIRVFLAWKNWRSPTACHQQYSVWFTLIFSLLSHRESGGGWSGLIWQLGCRRALGNSLLVIRDPPEAVSLSANIQDGSIRIPGRGDKEKGASLSKVPGSWHLTLLLLSHLPYWITSSCKGAWRMWSLSAWPYFVQLKILLLQGKENNIGTWAAVSATLLCLYYL